jgi:hypothetical protein
VGDAPTQELPQVPAAPKERAFSETMMIPPEGSSE